MGHPFRIGKEKSEKPGHPSVCRKGDRMHQLTWTSDAIIFVLVVAAVCASLLIAWWRFPSKNQLPLTHWRQLVLRFGLIGNTLSIALLCSFLFLALLAKYGVSRSSWQLLGAFSFLFCIALSLATALFGAFGRGVSRPLVMANGVVLAFLWYLLGLANSP